MRASRVASGSEGGPLLGFKRPNASQLANPGQHAVELAEDEYGPLNSFRLPSGGLLKCRQHLVETVAQIFEHVMAIHAHAMASVDRGRRTAAEGRSGNEMPKMPFRSKQPLPVRKLLLSGRHIRHSAMDRARSPSPRS